MGKRAEAGGGCPGSLRRRKESAFHLANITMRSKDVIRWKV